jgi:hypothetical protein
MDRNETIATIRKALKRRSGKAWSVTGGRGTAWGWIEIDAPPAQRTGHYVKDADAPDLPESYRLVDTGEPGGYMTPARRDELADLLGLDRVHFQGVKIPASDAYRQEYVDRAEGRTPTRFGEQYWD